MNPSTDVSLRRSPFGPAPSKWEQALTAAPAPNNWAREMRVPTSEQEPNSSVLVLSNQALGRIVVEPGPSSSDWAGKARCRPGSGPSPARPAECTDEASAAHRCASPGPGSDSTAAEPHPNGKLLMDRPPRIDSEHLRRTESCG